MIVFPELLELRKCQGHMRDAHALQRDKSFDGELASLQLPRKVLKRALSRDEVSDKVVQNVHSIHCSLARHRAPEPV